MKRRFLSIGILVLALLAIVACDSVLPASDDYEIRVLISYPKNTVDSPADYVYVKPGEDVYYPITLNEGFEYVGNDRGAEYVDGVLILEDLRYPTTVTIEVKQKEAEFFYRAQEGGHIEAEMTDGLLVFDEPVTLKATAEDGYTFIGWSEGDYLVEQGKLLSEEPSYTGMLSEEKPVFANFKSDAEAIVCYHLNGGRASGVDADVDVYYDTFPIGYYHYPNAIGDVGTFERSGHTLVEYSTGEDGSGFVTCPGGKIFVETDEVIHLWLQWEKWTAAAFFQVSESNDGYYIDKFTGTGDVVVVPGDIGGTKVIGIRKGAFTNIPMETLILHKNIQTIEGGAFRNCANINTLYMHDTIVKVSDDIFQSCNKYKNFRFNAARAPSQCSQSWGAYTTKFERAVYLAGPEHNSMIVLSGSSSLYSTDSPRLEQLMADAGYDFDVLNFGIQASCSQLFFLEFVQHFTDDGDVIIQAPEVGSGTMGVSISTTMMQVLQSTYNAFRYVDISKYTSLFSSIQSINATRAKSTDTTYEAQRSDRVTINLYGDRENEWKTGVDPNYKPGSQHVSGSYPSNTVITRFNEMYRIFEAQGVRVYYSFATMAGGAFKSSDADIAAYENRVDTKLLSPRISSLRDYIMPQELMYNSDSHTNVEGMILRTNTLARDLLAQFKKEGN